MRRHAADRLVIVEIIAEFRVVDMIFVFAADQLGRKQPLAPQPLAQRLHQLRIFGPALGQNVAHTVEYGLHGGEIVAAFVLFGLDEGGGFVERH